MKAYSAKFLLLIFVIVPFKSDARIGAGVDVQEDRSLYYNRGGNRNYYGGYYQRRRYYYYQQYYGRNRNNNDDGMDNNNVDDANENNVDDMNQNNVDVDDNQGDNNGVDDQVYIDGDADDYIATYAENNGTDADWYTRIVNAEKQVELDLKTWYYTPPGEWTAQEWGLFGGLAAILFSTLFCLCMCCCYSGGNKSSYITRQRASSTYDFDDYTSIDSRKASSSSSSGSSTESDDSATYDSIMRLRSD